MRKKDRALVRQKEKDEGKRATKDESNNQYSVRLLLDSLHYQTDEFATFTLRQLARHCRLVGESVPLEILSLPSMFLFLSLLSLQALPFCSATRRRLQLKCGRVYIGEELSLLQACTGTTERRAGCLLSLLPANF